MKKILLITWYENYNYGTSLQAYSLKKILENPNIVFDGENNYQKNKVDILRHIPHRRFLLCQKIKSALSISYYKKKIQQYYDKNIIDKNRMRERKNKFQRFNKDNFTFCSEKNCQTRKDLLEIGEKYDIYISGSDQIWNPEALDLTYLLWWVNNSKRKISYGSSLSKAKISNRDISIYKKYLSNFHFVSIRDKACRNQLSNIINKKVQTVLDPVLLIGKEGFKVKKTSKEDYLFTYFIGNILDYRLKAISFSQENNMPLNSLIYIDSKNVKEDKILEKYAIDEVDPIGFVEKIANAKVVLTDSFHATILSILFHIDFWVLQKDLDRPTQNIRIKELLKIVDLEDRWCNNVSEIKNVHIEDEIWEKVDKALKEYREESFEYLINSIEGSRD